MASSFGGKMRLLILGKCGCGKDTIRNLLTTKAEKEGLVVHSIDVGTILRERSNQDKEIKEVHKEGGIVPTTKVLDIFEEAIVNEHYILSGSPRRPEEAKWFLTNDNKVMMIYLKVTDETVYKRLEARGRWDDQRDVIKRRLDDFKITEQSIKLFRESGALYQLDSDDLTPEQICKRIWNQLKLGKKI